MEQIPLVWSTEKRKPSALVGCDINPRKISAARLRQLKASLDQFGLVEIPVVDVDNTIIAGHQRVEVLISVGLGMEDIDVHIPNRKLTDAEFKKYNLISNRDFGAFDIDALLANFEKDLLFDVGFTGKDLQQEQDKKPVNPEEDFDVPDMDLKSFEHYDYLVFVFRDTHDWINAASMFGLQKVNSSFSAKLRKFGLGRVVEGKKLIEMVEAKNAPEL